NHAVTMIAAARFQQLDGELNLNRIERALLEKLKTNAVTAVGTGHAVVEAIDDHCPLVRGGEHKGEFASYVAHGKSPLRDAIRAGQIESAGSIVLIAASRASPARCARVFPAYRCV